MTAGRKKDGLMKLSDDGVSEVNRDLNATSMNYEEIGVYRDGLRPVAAGGALREETTPWAFKSTPDDARGISRASSEAGRYPVTGVRRGRPVGARPSPILNRRPNSVSTCSLPVHA